MITFLRDRPWIWVWVAFLALFSAWTVLFTIALNNQPEKVPLKQLQSAAASEEVAPES